MLKAIAVLFALLLAVAPALAQDEGGWRFVSAQRLSDLIDEEYRFVNPRLSPDGSAIMWDERPNWCIYTFADESVRCIERTDDGRFPIARYNFPVWSPDGTEIAATENVFVYAMDGDVWTMDVVAGTMTNHTEDNFYGDMFDGDRPDDLALDFNPTYNPADGALYFFRARYLEGGDIRVTLELWRLGQDAPEQLHDFTYDFNATLPLYHPVAWSPDGRQLAMIILPQQFEQEPSTGVWVYDLESDTVTQVLRFDDFTAGMPSWQHEVVLPERVYWSQGGWVVLVRSPGSPSVSALSNALLISHEDGDITPLFDFSEIPDRASMPDMPFDAVVSPDGTSLWYLSYSPENEWSISELDLMSDSEPRLLSTGDYRPGPRQEAPPTTSIDGKVLFYDVLVTFEPR